MVILADGVVMRDGGVRRSCVIGRGLAIRLATSVRGERDGMALRWGSDGVECDFVANGRFFWFA